MTCYLVATTRVIDPERFDATYVRRVQELTPQFGGKYRMVAPSTTLESDWDDGVLIIISEWPDKAALQRFWDSPEYAEAKKMRKGLSETRVYSVEGDL